MLIYVLITTEFYTIIVTRKRHYNGGNIMWYERDRYRHLCDMHIDDWNPEFLSQFDPYDYVENLKLAGVENAMVYLQSHVGLCYFPTKVGKMHRALQGREDLIKKVVQLCREANISVTGYYSMIFNTVEHDRHPDWQLIDETGKTPRGRGFTGILPFSSGCAGRYGLCCPNNADYRSFVAEQIQEMADYFGRLDGMFYDMLFWPLVCHCDSCRKRWEQETGLPFPQPGEESALFSAKRRQWIGEFAMWASELTRKIMPGVSVQHNFASAMGRDGHNCIDEQVNDACDYAGGDLYGSIYDQSVTCKMYRNITKHQPFEYMFTRCVPNLSKHTTLRTHDEMLSIVLLTQAHHGASLAIDAIDPVGTLDQRVYRELGKVFWEAKQYRTDFAGELLSDVGVYYSLKGKYPKYRPLCNHEGTLSACESFVKNNLLFDVTGSFGDFSRYQSLLFSCPNENDAFENSRLVDYVKNGGQLYFSGVEASQLLNAFFGGRLVSYTPHQVVYVAPEDSYGCAFDRYTKKYPFHFDGAAPIVQGVDPQYVAATVTLPYTTQDNTSYASIHSNPPGIATDIPAVAVRNFGKGMVLWSALPLECVKDRASKALFYSLFTALLPVQSTLASDAPKDVELLVFRDGKSTQVNAIQMVAEDEARRIDDFEIALRLPSAPKSVARIGTEDAVPYTYANGIVHIPVNDFDKCAIFEMT